MDCAVPLLEGCNAFAHLCSIRFATLCLPCDACSSLLYVIMNQTWQQDATLEWDQPCAVVKYLGRVLHLYTLHKAHQCDHPANSLVLTLNTYSAAQGSHALWQSNCLQYNRHVNVNIGCQAPVIQGPCAPVSHCSCAKANEAETSSMTSHAAAWASVAAQSCKLLRRGAGSNGDNCSSNRCLSWTWGPLRPVSHCAALPAILARTCGKQHSIMLATGDAVSNHLRTQR